MSLWKSPISNKYTNSPQAHTLKTQTEIKETSLCTRHKASMTLEATVVIPIIAAVLTTILFFFRIIQVQVLVEEALIYSGRRVAVESSIVNSELAQFASAEVFLLSALEDAKVVQRYVENGRLGVVLAGSDFSGSQIVLQANYQVKLPIPIFGIDGISLWSRNVVRKWVGDMPISDKAGETYVYVTPSGEAYHSTASCQAINIKLHKKYLSEVKNLRGTNGQKYYGCSRCAKGSLETDEVYYTDYGDLYHGRIDCSYVKRTVNKQALSQVENRKPCSFCYE